MRDTGFYTRDDFNLDAIEVYKGPASTLFVRGSTGGVVDQVSKSPRLGGFEDGSITLGTNNEVRGVADVDIPLGDDAALRIDGMGMRANVTDRDFVLNQRWGIAPTLKIGFSGPTTFTLSLFHQQEDNVPDYGIPFVAGRPAPVPRDFYYGLAGDDRLDQRQHRRRQAGPRLQRPALGLRDAALRQLLVQHAAAQRLFAATPTSSRRPPPQHPWTTSSSIATGPASPASSSPR